MGKVKIVAESALSTLRISAADMVALQVRSRRSSCPDPPESLYQHLPTTAMSLMATIPGGRFEVSIPHPNEMGDGYPILKSPPAAEDGFVIAYARQLNRRYEAVEVLFQSKKCSVEKFHEIACRWVEKHEGKPTILTDRHAYFVPSIERWSVILRDSGYVALDPSSLSRKITEGMQQIPESLSNSGLVARIPIYAGLRQGTGVAQPVFARVSLTPVSYPDRQSNWMSFPEYLEVRSKLSCPPSSMVPDFREWLARLTAECSFERFIFHAGMLFGDCTEWWGDRNRRRTAHEGIDFAQGTDADGKVRNVPEGTPVRAIADGKIVAMLDDFLGKTIILRHPAFANENGDIFHTLYSHIQPESEAMEEAAKDRCLGRIGGSSNTGAPAHLHLTGAWIPESIRPDKIRMEHLSPGFAPIILTRFKVK